MKKSVVLGLGLCVVLAFTSCKSSESAYKKAYEKAQQQELAEPQVTTPVVVETPVVSTPVVETPKSTTTTSTIREEKVTVISGANSLKDYSVVCGSFSLKANAEGLKTYLDGQGYSAILAFNPENSMYRVIMGTYDDRLAAERARDTFKERYPNREDFQGSWILLRLH